VTETFNLYRRCDLELAQTYPKLAGGITNLLGSSSPPALLLGLTPESVAARRHGVLINYAE
jgi:hypothetical protein